MYGIVKKNDSLWHHGVKGQKWGIRRFQNPDGTLTALGKKRYEEHQIRLEEGVDRTPDGKIDYNSKNTRQLLSDNSDKEQSRVESLLRNNGIDLNKLYPRLSEVAFDRYDSKASRFATDEERRQLKELDKASDDARNKYWNTREQQGAHYEEEYRKLHPIKSAFDEMSVRRYAREKVPSDATVKQAEEEMKKAEAAVNKLYDTWRDRSLSEIMNTIPKEIQDDVFVYLRDNINQTV